MNNYRMIIDLIEGKPGTSPLEYTLKNHNELNKDKLKPHHSKALRDYSKKFGEINQFLSKYTIPPKNADTLYTKAIRHSKELKDDKGKPAKYNPVSTIVHLDDHLHYSKLPKDIRVYFGVDQDLEVGKSYMFHGYLSTVLSKQIAQSVVDGSIVMLLLKSGQSAYFMGDLSQSPQEKEILLPRGCIIKIESERDGIYTGAVTEPDKLNKA